MSRKRRDMMDRRARADGLLLVVGDPHSSPMYPNDRFRRLGELARRRRADHIHCTGDWTDFASLLDHGTAESQEGLRYADDVRAANDALEQLDRGLGSHRPGKSISLGNHDMRPDRHAAKRPELLGKLSWRDVRFAEHGWKTVGWREKGRVGPFLVSHHFGTRTGRPLGGIYLARKLAREAGQGVIVGHDHRFQHWVESYPERKDHAFVAGCFAHPDMQAESWCRETSHDWDIGLLWITLENGEVSSHTWERWS